MKIIYFADTDTALIEFSDAARKSEGEHLRGIVPSHGQGRRVRPRSGNGFAAASGVMVEIRAYGAA